MVDRLNAMFLADATSAFKMVENTEAAFLFCQVNGEPAVVLGVMRLDTSGKGIRRFRPLFLRLRPSDAITTIDGQRTDQVTDGDPHLEVTRQAGGSRDG